MTAGALTAEAMARLHARAFSAQRPWNAREFAGFLRSPLCFCVGDTTGFALARAAADEAELLTLAVHPAYRRKGRGRRLMDLWEDEARRRGARLAFLEVAAENDAAQALYALCGYTLAGERSGYYRRKDGSRIDAVLMRKALT